MRNLSPLLTQAQLIGAIDKLSLEAYLRLLCLFFQFQALSARIKQGFACIRISSHDAAKTLLGQWHGEPEFGRVHGRRAISQAHTWGHKQH